MTRSRYDAFLEGDFDAMDRREKRGLALFIDYACVACHDGAGLGGRAMRKFPLVRHPIWSMGDHAGVKTLREAFDAFGRMLEEERRYVRMEFYNDASRYAYLVKYLGKERVELLRQGFFTAEDANASYKMMTGEGCASCHDRRDFRVSVEKLKQTGFPFENRGAFLGSERAKRFFRVPLLRNIVRTAPYFHNGTVEKLEEAIRLMVSYQLRRKISDDEVNDMVAFFKAVDGEGR